MNKIKTITAAAVIFASFYTLIATGSLNIQPVYSAQFQKLMGDINSSGSVDFQDLITLFQNWGSSPNNPNSDLDGNGKVDFQDLIALFQNWGGKRKNGNNFANKTGNLNSTGSNLKVLEGTLVRRIADDFNNKKVITDYFLQTRSGKMYNISSLPGVSNIADGSTLKITPSGSQTTIKVSGSQITSSKIEVIRTPSKILQDSIGGRRVAVILVNYNSDNRKPWTKQDAANQLFNNQDSTNNFLKEASYGKTSLSGKIFGWYNVTTAKNSCWDVNGAIKAADPEIDYSQFDEIVVMMPEIDCDGVGGFGYLSKIAVPSNDSGGNLNMYFAKINGFNGSQKAKFIIAHEIGHTYGLPHARGVWCPDKDYSSIVSCLAKEKVYYPKFDDEYANIYDSMGFSLTPMHFNAAYKHKINWLANVPEITKGGIYTLGPLEVSDISEIPSIDRYRKPTPDPKILPSFPKAYRIPLNYNASRDGRFLYLEYRKPLGFDDKPILRSGKEGLLVNMYFTYTGDAYLLSNGPDYLDYLVKIGDEFYDKSDNIKITPLQSSLPNVLPVAVSFGDCKPGLLRISNYSANKVTVPLKPDNNQGLKARIQFQIANSDSLGCNSSKFILKNEIIGAPSGTAIYFSGPPEITANEVILAPGQNSLITADLTIPATSEKSFKVLLSVARDNDNGQQLTYLPISETVIQITKPASIKIKSQLNDPLVLYNYELNKLNFEIKRNSNFTEQIKSISISGLPSYGFNISIDFDNKPANRIENRPSRSDLIIKQFDFYSFDPQTLIPANGSKNIGIGFSPSFKDRAGDYQFNIKIETNITKYNLPPLKIKVLGPRPPDTPVNYFPANGATVNVKRAITLVSSPYKHLNSNTSLSSSQWLIKNPISGKVVWNSKEIPVDRTVSTANSYLVPFWVLKPFSVYLWQVRYKSSQGAWSAWSKPTIFRTSL